MNYMLYCLIAAIGYASSLAGLQWADEQDSVGEQKCVDIDRSKILNRIPVSCERVLRLDPHQTIISLSPNGKKLLVYLTNTLSYALVEAESGRSITTLSKHACCEDVPCSNAFNPSSTLFALATHCFKAHHDVLKLVNEQNAEQVLTLPDFKTESIAISANGKVVACAGGCSEGKIALFLQQSDNTFAHAKTFGRGHLIALNDDGTRLAALNHDQVVIYDMKTEQPSQIFAHAMHDVPYLNFASTDDLMVGCGSAKVPGKNMVARIVHIAQPAEHMQVATIADVGNKMVHISKGAPRITYAIDNQEYSVELQKPEGRINILQFNDNDTQLTACTDGELYRYDIGQLAHAEMRFLKPTAHMTPHNFELARKITQLTDEQHERIVMQDDVAQLSQVEQEIHALFAPVKPKSCNSLINRICVPLVGFAAAAMALCALRN